MKVLQSGILMCVFFTILDVLRPTESKKVVFSVWTVCATQASKKNKKKTNTITEFGIYVQTLDMHEQAFGYDR